MHRHPRPAILGSLILLAVSLLTVTAINPVECCRFISRSIRPHLQESERKGSELDTGGRGTLGHTFRAVPDCGSPRGILAVQYQYPPQYYRPPTYQYPAPYGYVPQPPPQLATSCVTSAGACPLAMALTVGSPCTCYSPYGTYFGVAR